MEKKAPGLLESTVCQGLGHASPRKGKGRAVSASPLRPSDRFPLVSIIVPVYNEACGIVSALEALRPSASVFPTEIIVVDGQSHDKTALLAQEVGARVFIAPTPGRALQMHLGAQEARGEILLFLHADTQLPPTWQACLAEAFLPKNAHPDRPAPAAIAFRLAFDSNGWPYRLIAQMAHLRGRITGIPQGDQAFALTRETYFSAGGFPAVPLMEEYLFVPRVRKLGRVDILPDKVVTSSRRYQKSGPFRTALRNALLIGLFYLGVTPERLARFYR